MLLSVYETQSCFQTAPTIALVTWPPWKLAAHHNTTDYHYITTLGCHTRDCTQPARHPANKAEHPHTRPDKAKAPNKTHL